MSLTINFTSLHLKSIYSLLYNLLNATGKQDERIIYL